MGTKHRDELDPYGYTDEEYLRAKCLDLEEEVERLRRQVKAARGVPHLSMSGDHTSAFRLGHAVAIAKVIVAVAEAGRE